MMVKLIGTVGTRRAKIGASWLFQPSDKDHLMVSTPLSGVVLGSDGAVRVSVVGALCLPIHVNVTTSQ